jgi:RES domain
VPAPYDFSKISPRVVELAGPWFRVHQASKGPVYFGRNGLNRWDSPDGDYGVMYAAESWQGALMESVLHDPTTKIVLESELAKRSIALVSTSIDLRVVDLSNGKTLRALGITESETQGTYLKSQGISKAVYSAGWNVNGIRYASRLDPALSCLALFDFPPGQMFLQDLGNLLSSFNRNLMSSMLRAYGIRLVDDSSTLL